MCGAVRRAIIYLNAMKIYLKKKYNNNNNKSVAKTEQERMELCLIDDALKLLFLFVSSSFQIPFYSVRRPNKGIKGEQMHQRTNKLSKNRW